MRSKIRLVITLFLAALFLCAPRLLSHVGQDWLLGPDAPCWMANLLVGTSTCSTSGLAFDSTFHEFGTVIEGAAVPHSYRFRNAGREPIAIVRTIKDCGCNEVEFPRGPIAPGEEGTVRVVFETDKKPGAQTKTVTLVTSEADEGRTTLVLKGYVRSVLEVIAEEAADRDRRGSRLPGEEFESSWRVRLKGGASDLMLGDVEGDFIAPRLEPTGDEGTWRLTARLTASDGPGIRVGTIELRCSLEGEDLSYQVPVQVFVDRPLRCLTARLALRPDESGVRRGRLFVAVQWPGLVTVDRVESSSPDLEIERLFEDESRLQLEIRLPAGLSLPEGASVTLHPRRTDTGPELPPLTVPVAIKE